MNIEVKLGADEVLEIVLAAVKRKYQITEGEIALTWNSLPCDADVSCTVTVQEKVNDSNSF